MSREAAAAARLEWLAVDGEMARTILAKDWSQTPLGPLETWPQALRTTVSLCLASNFPINIIWGPEHIQIYNDGYRVVCGAVHPRALGEAYHVTWASAWPAIGQPFERALAGETTFLENQRMFLERNGYQEETFFTFSLSPIRNEHGGVEGLFHPVTETTANLLGERRTAAIRDMVARAGKGKAFRETAALAFEVLQRQELDLPFALLYAVDESGRAARLIASSGLAEGHALAPPEIALARDEIARAPGAAAWPLREAIDSARPVELSGLAARFGSFRAGPYPEPPGTCFLTPIRAGGGQPIAVLIAAASARLPLDEKYRTFFDLLGASLAGCLNTALAHEEERKRAEALAQLDRAKTAFFSNISHEFRTPLTLMLGPLEELLSGKRGDLPADAAGEVQVVNRNALRLLKLVNALLDFSRLEANRVLARFEPTDLARLTADLGAAFRSMVEKAGLRFVVAIDELPEPVYVDREMWEKIVLNLLSNAFKFTFAGEIRLALTARPGAVELAVSDTGTGIPEAERAKVFQRFHRIQGAQGRTHEGTGIGLSLVQELVKLHGGAVRLASEEGRGSTFAVEVPLGASHLPPDQVSQAAPGVVRASRLAQELSDEAAQWLQDEPAPVEAGPAARADPQPRKRVLVADDNADLRAYLVRLLAPRYDVEAVDNGREALRAMERAAPDLLVSDIMMPVMNGFELLQALRAHQTLRRVPVILLSARAGEEAKVEGLEAGADDYLIKPFSARELIARVQTHLTLSAVRDELARGQEALRMRDEFLSIASHELRTPLTPLKIQIQGLVRAVRLGRLETLSAARLQRLAIICETQLSRLGSLIEDLLDVSRMRTGHLELKPQPTDLNRLVHGICERYLPLLKASGFELELLAEPDLEAPVDPMRLEQVLGNLIGNALKYAAPCRLQIGLRREGDRVALSVRDRGPGIARDRQEKIFHRFETAAAPDGAGGLGLGLYIAREIVRAHGGTLEVESDAGQDALFVVRLPLGRAAP